MNSVKILHTGDLHLDCKFAGLPVEKSKIRRRELKDSFANAVSLCDDADIVLICGDIFDNQSFTKSTVSFLSKVFSDNPRKSFFIVMGNHDPYNSKAAQMLKEAIPENVVIFSDKAEYIELDELKVRVYGISFSDRYEYDSLLKEFRVIEDDYINILLLHGDLVGSVSESKYNPVCEELISQSGFDYIALGHVHNFSGIKSSGTTHYAYCGVHEPHGFDECGEKGVIYGTVTKDKCDLSFVETARRKYFSFDIDVSEAKSIDDVIDMVRAVVSDTDSVYRINLMGFIEDCISIDTELIKSLLNAFYVILNDNTHHRYNLELLSEETGLKGYIAKNVLKELKTCADSEVNLICSASDYLFELIDNGE